MKKKENGNAPVMFIFVFFMIFLLFGVAATMMTYAQVMTHQHEIDDDLCDSVLSSMVVDLDRYNNEQKAYGVQAPTNTADDQVAVFYKSVDNSFSLYKSCFDNAKRQNDPAFFQNFSYDTYILYEVDPKQNKITVTSFSPNGQKTVTTGTCGSIQTPDGKKVTETSAYAKVSFAVKTYFRNIPAAQKARKIYCTIDQTNYLQK
jgi:hypothetical protein